MHLTTRARFATIAIGVALVLGACGSPQDTPAPSTSAPTTTSLATATVGAPPASSVPTAATASGLVFTYYFYWYDSQTSGHLQPSSLHTHFPSGEQPSWRSVDWQRKQLSDMTYAGIDVALAVYWGFDRPQDIWSTAGLGVLAQAGRIMAQRGEKAPRIGLFLDTSIVNMRDLTTVSGQQWFYANFKDFFTRIPRDQWALIDGRPIAFLFTSDFTAAVNQSTFDYVYQHFESDFGVRPYIVREVSWDSPILRWEAGQRVRDAANPIRTDNRYLWGAAMHGYNDCCGVAAVGPGFDDRGLPGRSGTFTDRESGAFYLRSFQAAIRSGKPYVVIETWNEFHEASGIAEAREYGRAYLDITRELSAFFKAAR